MNETKRGEEIRKVITKGKRGKHSNGGKGGREDLESGNRLRGWLKVYGIVQGELIDIHAVNEQDRGTREEREDARVGRKKVPDTKVSEKVRVGKGEFTFTFRKVCDKTEQEARKLIEIAEEKKRERIETWQKQAEKEAAAAAAEAR